MSRAVVCAVIVAAGAFVRAHAQADGSTAALTDEQQVIAVESQWVAAEVHRDAAVLDRVLDDRFILNSSSGELRDKATVIADVLRWTMVAQTITDRSVLIDGDTAIVFGTANFRFAVEGRDDAVSAGRYTTVYVKRDSRWRALALQMTALKAQ